MKSISSIIGQIAVFALVAILLGVFSSSPTFHHFEEGKALIRLSFSHAGDRSVECRKRTAQELRDLPPNMRKPLDCPRRRVPIHVEVILDNNLVYSSILPPTGLSGDGSSQVYEGFVVSPGVHHLEVRLRDSRRTTGFDYERKGEIILSPLENFVVDFRSEEGILFIEGDSNGQVN